MRDPSLKRWEVIGVAALLLIIVLIPVSLSRQRARMEEVGFSDSPPAFVGNAACRPCHEKVFADWRGSDHDRAMAVASDSTVLGDFKDTEITHRGITSRFYRREGRFYVKTEGPDGEMGEFEISHTFGFEPLQQYLIAFPGGRLQALSLAWDTERNRWFPLYPDAEIPADDWLHWTRNGHNWNGMCAECHSTDLRKNYDPVSQTYATTWSDINVGCEACHGPGSRHMQWAELPPMARPHLEQAGLTIGTSGISSAEQVELCAPCHSRRSELGDYDHTGLELLDHMIPALLREGLYYADGQILDEVYVYGSFLQSKMYARDVRCGDCHDSHTLKLVREGNELCLQCHEREVYDSPGHHFHEKRAGGRPNEGALCVKCHMVERLYMVVDWRADHSFRVPRPDLTAGIDTPNACNQAACHADKPLQWSIDAYRRWYGEVRRPHYATAFAAARAGEPSRGELDRLAENPLQPVIVRATALELLARDPGTAAAAAIEAALLAGEPLLRHTAALNLRVADSARRTELLAPLLSDPVKAVRMAAVSRLADLPRESWKAYRREAFARCLREYEQAMAHSLDFPESALNLGNLYAAMGRTGEAERYYRLALQIDDLFLPAQINLAVQLSADGRYTEAARILREAADAYPEIVEPAYSLGLLLVEAGKPEEAAGWLRRALAIDPKRSRARYNLGLLLQQLGRSGEALHELEAALELEPENIDYLYALATHLIDRRDLAAAGELAERIIAAQPDLSLGRELKEMVRRKLEER